MYGYNSFFRRGAIGRLIAEPRRARDARRAADRWPKTNRTRPKLYGYTVHGAIRLRAGTMRPKGRSRSSYNIMYAIMCGLRGPRNSLPAVVNGVNTDIIRACTRVRVSVVQTKDEKTSIMCATCYSNKIRFGRIVKREKTKNSREKKTVVTGVVVVVVKSGSLDGQRSR